MGAIFSRLSSALVFTLIISLSCEAFAQNAGANSDKNKNLGGPRKQLATIVFAGLGGAVLGLSTLSFYGRPQERLNNIAIGFALGIMAGTAFVTYKTATNPSELYGRQRDIEELQAVSSAHAWQATTPGPLAFTFSSSF